MSTPLASDSHVGDLFASQVSLSGERAAIGAPEEDSNGNDAGAVYFYGLTVQDPRWKPGGSVDRSSQ